MPYPVIATVVFAGSVARGFTGFGAVLFTLPLLSLWLPVKQAVPMLAALGLANGLWLTWRVRKLAHPAEAARLLAGGVPGVIAGLALFHQASDAALRAGLGAGVTALGLWLALSAGRRPASAPEWLGPGAGALGGVLGGLYGLSGPAPLFYLAARPLHHHVYRATLLLYITVLDIVLGCGFTLTGALSGSLWLTALLLLPLSVAGSYLGERLQHGAGEPGFRRLTGAALVMMGLAVIWSARRG